MIACPGAGVKGSVVLYDATRPVRAPRTFGRGLNRFAGQHEGTKPYTVADADAAARMFGELEDSRRAHAENCNDPAWDRQAEALAAEYDREMASR